MNGNTISLDMQKYSIIFIIFVFLFLIFLHLEELLKSKRDILCFSILQLVVMGID